MVSNGGNRGDIRSPCDDRVETPAQLAERVGVSKYQINKLIRDGKLEHLKICDRKYIPSGGWPRYVEANTKGGKQCQGETMDHDSAISRIEVRGTSVGQTQASQDAAASAQLVRQTARRLSHSSRNGSSPAGSGQQPALVIPLRSS